MALDQAILKCISTDTVRAVMRSYVPEGISPALHRSSYAPNGEEGDDPVKSWRETCKVLEQSLEGLVDDAIARKTCLVLEGVSLVPSTKWIDKWEDSGGYACGVLLTVTKEDVHKSLLLKRGFLTGNQENEQQKLQDFHRVRLIQDEMIRRAQAAEWLLIEQKIEPDPLEIIENEFLEKEGCVNPFYSVPLDSSQLDSNNLPSILGQARGKDDIANDDRMNEIRREQTDAVNGDTPTRLP